MQNSFDPQVEKNKRTKHPVTQALDNINLFPPFSIENANYSELRDEGLKALGAKIGSYSSDINKLAL